MEITLVLRMNRVLQLLHFAKCNLHFYGVFSIFCIIGLNQKSLVRSNFFKTLNFVLNITASMCGISTKNLVREYWTHTTLLAEMTMDSKQKTSPSEYRSILTIQC